ncbi:MAG: endonuclease/exonuclease/phosphatase family protein [Promethearchaeota archaeon]
MRDNEKISLIIILSFFIFLFIETTINFVLYINSVIFLKWKELTSVLPWILIYLGVIFGGISLKYKFFKESAREFIMLIIITIALRFFAQFYIYPPEIYLLILTMLFTLLLLFFVDFSNFFVKYNVYNDNKIEIILIGLIFGLGLHLFILILSLSSNLCVNILKIPIIIVFGLIILIFEKKIIPDLEIKQNYDDNNSKQNTIDKQELKLKHFFFIGAALFYCLNWIFNPVALSAYDTFILNIFAYGFLYYSVIILISLIFSYLLLKFILSQRKEIFTTKFALILNIFLILMNCCAILILEQDNSIISTIYLSSLIIISVFITLFNLLYYIIAYKMPGRTKSYIGLIILFFGFAFFYAIAIINTWTLHLSFLLNISIFSAIIGIFIILEIKKTPILIKKIKNINILNLNFNKIIGMLFAIIIGLNIFSIAYISASRNLEESTNKELIVLVWNIHNGIGVDGKFDLDRLIEEIKEYNPDIIGLNEVDKGVMKTGFVDICSYFAYKLGMRYFYGPTFFKHYGNAFFSKYPIKEIKNYQLPLNSKFVAEPRGVIKAKVIIDNSEWTIYVNHLDVNEENRIKQVSAVIELIEKEPFEKIIWMGDFNAKPDSEPYKLINSTSEKIKFIDTHKYLNKEPELTGGFNPDNEYKPTVRIDYIFCSPDLVPVDTDVHWSIASDHSAVITKFKL